MVNKTFDLQLSSGKKGIRKSIQDSSQGRASLLPSQSGEQHNKIKVTQKKTADLSSLCDNIGIQVFKKAAPPPATPPKKILEKSRSPLERSLSDLERSQIEKSNLEIQQLDFASLNYQQLDSGLQKQTGESYDYKLRYTMGRLSGKSTAGADWKSILDSKKVSTLFRRDR